MAQTDTRLQWRSEGDSYVLIPDLISVQWPRTTELEGTPRGVLELPQTIFIPVKAGPESVVGDATIRFTPDGVIMNESEAPFTLEDDVTVSIVHPTDPTATELEGVNPMLFVNWRGNLPDWSVQHTSPSRPKKGAPLAAWLVFAIRSRSRWLPSPGRSRPNACDAGRDKASRLRCETTGRSSN